MRILLVSETLAAGGAEAFVLRLARKLAQIGHDCDLLCVNADLMDERLVGQFADVRVIAIPIPALRWVKRFDRGLKLLGIDWSLQLRLSTAWVRRRLLGRYDVIHTHLFGSDQLFARLKRRFPELRILSTLHGDYPLYEAARNRSQREFIPNWRKKVAEVTTAINRWVYIARPQFELFTKTFGVAPDRLVKIYNGYEPPAPLPAPEGGRRDGHPLAFIMAARGIREKGWAVLVDAFSRLRADSRLVLVGEGSALDELKRRHGGDSRMVFAGFHPNPPELIAQADVFVFPSSYPGESLPTVVIEALYCGVPVIATAVGEIADMLKAEDGQRAGQLVSGSSEDELTTALAAAMQRYADDRALLERHSALTGRAFRKFDMDECARRYLELYREVTE